MARLTSITSKDQVAAKDHAIVDGIVGEPRRAAGTVHDVPALSGARRPRWRIWAPSSASRARSTCECACSPR